MLFSTLLLAPIDICSLSLFTSFFLISTNCLLLLSLLLDTPLVFFYAFDCSYDGKPDSLYLTSISFGLKSFSSSLEN